MTSVDVEQLSCQELVELVTAYLEGALPETEHARFEEHPPRAVRGDQPAADDERRPGPRARTRAGAVPARIARERVEHVAAPVEEDAAVAGGVRLDGREALGPDTCRRSEQGERDES